MRASAFAVLLAASTGAHAAADSGYTYTLLDHEGRYTHIIVGGINNRGDVVGLISEPPDEDGSDAGFVHTHGRYQIVRYPGAGYTRFLAVNDRGQVVGLASGDGGLVYFVYDKGSFTPVPLPGWPSDINNRGEIVGSFSDGSGTHGYRYADGDVETIDVPGSTHTEATGINELGEIVGWFESDGQPVLSFIVQDGAFTTLAFPDAHETLAADINNRGEIVGRLQQTYGWRGFVYDGEYHVFVVPASVHCEGGNQYPLTDPRANNDRGQIAGEWYGYAAGDFGGFVATPARRPGSAELPPCG